jgi:hypothetical protein
MVSPGIFLLLGVFLFLRLTLFFLRLFLGLLWSLC